MAEADGTYLEMIKSYLNPRDLLKFYTSSTKLLNMLSHKIVFESTYSFSRSSWTSMKRLNRLVETRGVWPISPVRTLRLLCGKRCEFCLNDTSSNPNSNPIPRLVRPGWPVFCCWPCLSDSRPFRLSRANTWPGVSIRNITRPWSKLIFRPDQDKFYHKQFYLANREILLDIFNHKRILAYPCGFRYLKIGTGEPLSERETNSVGSHDQIEILWSARHVKGGECIGGLMSADLIQPLVEYLKTPNNLGIDHFLLTKIPNAPSLEDYEPFLQAFEAIRPKAELHERTQSELIRTQKDLARYRMIENAIASLSLVASAITPILVQSFVETFSFFRQEFWNIRTFQRIILCYQEEHNLSLRHPLTWDTGDFRLNYDLTRLFAPLLRAPTRVDPDDIDTYAKSFLSTCIEHLYRNEGWRANAVYDDGGHLRVTFGPNYRLMIMPQGWSTPRRPRSVTREWRGLENRRRL